MRTSTVFPPVADTVHETSYQLSPETASVLRRNRETVSRCHGLHVQTLCASVMRSVIHCLANMSATLLYCVRRLQALIIISGLGGANK